MNVRLRLFIALLSIFSISNLNTFSQANSDRKTQLIAEGVIKDILVKIKASDEGHSLFNNLDTGNLQFSYNTPLLNRRGWIVRWQMERGTAIVPNPNLPAKSTEIKVVKDENGILLKLFVSTEQGDLMEESTEIFHVSEKPRMDIGYFLKTHGENPALKNRIHQIIAGEIALIPK